MSAFVELGTEPAGPTHQLAPHQHRLAEVVARKQKIGRPVGLELGIASTTALRDAILVGVDDVRVRMRLKERHQCEERVRLQRAAGLEEQDELATGCRERVADLPIAIRLSLDRCNGCAQFRCVCVHTKHDADQRSLLPREPRSAHLLERLRAWHMERQPPLVLVVERSGDRSAAQARDAPVFPELALETTKSGVLRGSRQPEGPAKRAVTKRPLRCHAFCHCMQPPCQLDLGPVVHGRLLAQPGFRFQECCLEVAEHCIQPRDLALKFARIGVVVGVLSGRCRRSCRERFGHLDGCSPEWPRPPALLALPSTSGGTRSGCTRRRHEARN